MAGQSKEAGELTPKQKSKIILRHALLQLICLCLPGQSEVQLFTDLCQGDANRAAQLLSITMSMSGAVEFFVGPTIGKLSDSIGRKPFFFGYPLYGMVAWTAMALFPENLVICCVGRTLGWSMVTLFGGTILTSVAGADFCSGDDLAQFYADFWAVIGMGVLGGQLIGDNVLIATGSPRYTYFVRAAVSAVHFAHNCLYMIETLPPEKRRPCVP